MEKGNLKGFELGSWNKGVQSSQNTTDPTNIYKTYYFQAGKKRIRLCKKNIHEHLLKTRSSDTQRKPNIAKTAK